MRTRGNKIFDAEGIRISLVDRLIATRDNVKIQLAVNLLNGYNFTK